MSLIYNGNTIKKLIYNGNECKKASYNGTEVFASQTQKTETITYQIYRCHTYTIHEYYTERYYYYYNTPYTISGAIIQSISPSYITLSSDEINGYVRDSVQINFSFSGDTISNSEGGKYGGAITVHEYVSTSLSVTYLI